ncbi:DUF6434 domain-containing protein [Duganella qianjiadongensis]|uniref:DUF6434 domain-containing protein n=1 Tax=Duganella qianjiadongensis TaxID=2692176 RepID=A0ABW9VFT8_9BURK|nr:DUF6434 domain-containing protein [Duganella qianjiadongensis]MYM37740.1 hypothetical protein [Duganella qianjiadongensis]
MKFDWHVGEISRATEIDHNYRNTQNVRRFLVRECGAAFRFDRAFMAWIRSGQAKNMGEAADLWIRSHTGRGEIAP